MALIEHIKVAPGLDWVAIPSLGIFMQCGCPPDSIKHLIKRGLIRDKNQGRGVLHETGPNVVLLADLSTQNGLFANLAEFSILQMFYRQGMMLPQHPGFSREKPLMIGDETQIKAQLAYVFRGNYGLVSEAELIEAGTSPSEAAELMRIKLYFAFGSIKPSEDLLETRILAEQAVEIKPGAFVSRLDTNRFEIRVGQERCTIDLNLAAGESFQPTYQLAYQPFRPQFFSVIHSGEGDGWDINRPSMASIVCYGPEIYLIDAGPHIGHSLQALGLSLNSVRGIFHTHAHDDHFAGLTELMRGDRKIEYYATSLVKHSVNKKLQALLNVDFPVLERFFHVAELNAESWNNINGLEVFPSFSPHPVETNCFRFRVRTEAGDKIYHHLADIASAANLEKMLQTHPEQNGISPSRLASVLAHYRLPADIKKIDIGGGLVHGHAQDFLNDPTPRKVLAHLPGELSPEQSRVGLRAPFGSIDHLVKAEIDARPTRAMRALHHYFPGVPFEGFHELLNQPITELEPGKTLQNPGSDVYLILSGLINEAGQASEVQRGISEFAAGYLLGEDPHCDLSCLVARSFVQMLRIPRVIFEGFLSKYGLKERLTQDQERRHLLQSCVLFQDISWSPRLYKMTRSMHPTSIKGQQSIDRFQGHFVFLLATGTIEIFRGSYREVLKPGQFCYEDHVLPEVESLGLKLRALEPCTGFLIPEVVLRDIPAIAWKLLETYKHRARRIAKQLSKDQEQDQSPSEGSRAAGPRSRPKRIIG